MRRAQSHYSQLFRWLSANPVDMRNVEIRGTKFGSGVKTKLTVSEDEEGFFMEVPSKLVLSKDYVWRAAESDEVLKGCLDALGDFAKTARGAILTFLLVQITATSPDISEYVGSDDPWTTYVLYIETERGLPTFWSDLERNYATGTSLGPALQAKMRGLDREFENFRHCLHDVPWCKRHWFDPASGKLSIEDWKVVDSMYRSRIMEFPFHGPCMVPVADMTNHAHQDAIARTEVDDETHSVRLTFDKHPRILKGEEVTISYGQEKGACEMLFSYGFIDDEMERAEHIFLSLESPTDDPLWAYKMHAFDCVPGVRVLHEVTGASIKWISPFIWLQCVNEEDGIDFGVVEQDDGSRELKATWKGQRVDNVADLEEAMRADEMWDLFNLRAHELVTMRLADEIASREESFRTRQQEEWYANRDESSRAWRLAERLRRLELTMLKEAQAHFTANKSWLCTNSRVVMRYFGGEDTEDMWAQYRNDADAQQP